MVVAYFEPGGDRFEGIGAFFKVEIHALLLFAVETWVLTLSMERALSIFQHRVAQRLTGRKPRIRGMGVGNTPHWRKQCWNKDSRGSGHTSCGGRIRSHSILQRDQFWTSVVSLLGGREHRCIGGGGNMTVYIWEVQRRGQRRNWAERRQ